MVQVAALDKDNKVLPAGKIGEVCIQGPNVTKGYLNRPEANEEAFAGALPTCLSNCSNAATSSCSCHCLCLPDYLIT